MTHSTDAEMEQCAENTDREIWREREGDFYANSIHVTKQGGIGIDVGGHVIVLPVAKWHELAVKEFGPIPLKPNAALNPEGE